MATNFTAEICQHHVTPDLCEDISCHEFCLWGIAHKHQQGQQGTDLKKAWPEAVNGWLVVKVGGLLPLGPFYRIKRGIPFLVDHENALL